MTSTLRPARPADAEAGAAMHNACSLWVPEDGAREYHEDLGTWEIRMVGP